MDESTKIFLTYRGEKKKFREEAYKHAANCGVKMTDKIADKIHKMLGEMEDPSEFHFGITFGELNLLPDEKV